MIKENGLLGCFGEGKGIAVSNQKSSPNLPARQGFGARPLALSFNKEEQQFCFVEQTEDFGYARAARSGMRALFSIKAFTLIELLVVVLIIGILAAVALPQYQVAVLKSRTAELIQRVNEVKRAQEMYYLANNTYTMKLEELDFGVEAVAQNETGSPIIYQTPQGEHINLYSSGFVSVGIPGKIAVLRYYDHTFVENARSGLGCHAKTDLAKQVCKSLGGHILTSNTDCLAAGEGETCFAYETDLF